MSLTTQPPNLSKVKFVAGGGFEQACAAEFERPEDRGQADHGTRVYEGAATGLDNFLRGLSDGLVDDEYPGTALDSYRVIDAPGNKRRVTLVFKGTMYSVRQAETNDSSVFTTFQFKQGDTTTGADASVECECPQTEYRYVVQGAKPTTREFTGPDNYQARKIKLWNLQPSNASGTAITVINRCSRFDVRRAGSSWEVTEVWIRELSMPMDNSFVDTIPGTEVVQPSS